MLALGLALAALAAAKPCPAADANLKSLNKGDGKVSVTFRSQIDEELQVYWMTREGEEHDVGILEPLGEVMHQSFEGHAFRVRRMVGAKEVVAETLLGRTTRQRVLIEACGAALAYFCLQVPFLSLNGVCEACAHARADARALSLLSGVHVACAVLFALCARPALAATGPPGLVAAGGTVIIIANGAAAGSGGS